MQFVLSACVVQQKRKHAERLNDSMLQRLHSGEDGREVEIGEALRFGNGRDQGCFANDAEGVPILA